MDTRVSLVVIKQIESRHFNFTKLLRASGKLEEVLVKLQGVTVSFKEAS